MALMTPKTSNRPAPHFHTLVCRHQPAWRLVRKHVPDSDPGCALQSTSMPALHGRNVPNFHDGGNVAP